MTDPTERFSNRVDTYVRARPSYPPEVLDLLAEHCGLVPQAAVADVGAGTSILTRLLLGRGATVFAVEPNTAMRTAAEAALGSEPGFRSIAATAEATTLSYTPAPGQPGHAEMLAALATLFAEHQQAGKVHLDYDTTVFYGRLL